MTTSKKKTMEFIDVIADMFPDAEAELDYTNSFELTIAVLLSAQTTDIGVNRVTKGLFKRFKTPEDYLEVDVTEIEKYIKTIGLYRTKAKNIQKLCRDLIDKYNGEIPGNYDDLVSLAGVGRKTANVVLSVAFDTPRIAVDTHVERISKRLGIARYKDSPLQVEETLMRKIPAERWSKTHHQLIFFGRYHCLARNPKCHECPLLAECREGQKRLKKGLVKI